LELEIRGVSLNVNNVAKVRIRNGGAGSIAATNGLDMGKGRVLARIGVHGNTGRSTTGAATGAEVCFQYKGVHLCSGLKWLGMSAGITLEICSRRCNIVTVHILTSNTKLHFISIPSVDFKFKPSILKQWTYKKTSTKGAVFV
jgi:hypothetical protein